MKHGIMRSARVELALLLAALLLFTGCGRNRNAESAAADTPEPTATSQPSPTVPPPTLAPTPTWTPAAISPLNSPLASPLATPAPTDQSSVPVYGYEVANVYPHDPDAFTQGLIWRDGEFYEGTGLHGRSSLRRVALESGEVLQSVSLPEQYFGEGITLLGDKIYQLTWQSNVGFIYDSESFEVLEEFSYPTEGWGITHDGTQLIMSDGTSTLYFWDPETLETVGQVTVTHEGQPVERLNELEYVDGLVYANVWQTDWILMIDPASGEVQGVIDLSGLLSEDARTGNEDVLNGIAYDPEGERLFVTGKLWPQLFEIELILE